MKVFHGSTLEVKTAEILKNQKLVDFGNGFYTTTNQEQAEKWAKIKQNRLNETSAIVSCYEFDDEILKNNIYNVLFFDKTDEDWLHFVVKNRKDKTMHPFDLVKGAVANDTLYQTLSLFETGILNEFETINRLKTHLLFDQISFHTNKILKELKFKKSYKI